MIPLKQFRTHSRVALTFVLIQVIVLVQGQSGQPSPGTISNTQNNGSAKQTDPAAQTNGNNPNPPQNEYSEFNSGIQPYSYGYNTGIRPYSYSYTYPQNGARPQVTYNNPAQPMYGAAPQPAPGGYIQPYPVYPVPVNNGYAPYPGQPMPAYGGYPPAPMPPMNMMQNAPNMPMPPSMPNIGATPGFNPAEFDLPVTAGEGNKNNNNNQNGFEDFNVDQALGGSTNDNSNNGNNDLNSELANLANPSAVAGTAGSNNNNNNNALTANGAQIPTSLNDFQIDGIGTNPVNNNNNNNNQGNNAFNGLPNDILRQLGAANVNPPNNNNGNGDFGDLGLGNLGNNSPANNNNGQDFNFGGSNNNLNFDLNFPAASQINERQVRNAEDASMNKAAHQKLRKLVAADSKLLKQAKLSVSKKPFVNSKANIKKGV